MIDANKRSDPQCSIERPIAGCVQGRDPLRIEVIYGFFDGIADANFDICLKCG